VKIFKKRIDINDAVENWMLNEKKCGKLRGKRGRLFRLFSTLGKMWKSRM
jgi:hypothetical protein